MTDMEKNRLFDEVECVLEIARQAGGNKISIYIDQFQSVSWRHGSPEEGEVDCYFTGYIGDVSPDGIVWLFEREIENQRAYYKCRILLDNGSILHVDEKNQFIIFQNLLYRVWQENEEVHVFGETRRQKIYKYSCLLRVAESELPWGEGESELERMSSMEPGRFSLMEPYRTTKLFDVDFSWTEYGGLKTTFFKDDFGDYYGEDKGEEGFYLIPPEYISKYRDLAEDQQNWLLEGGAQKLGSEGWVQSRWGWEPTEILYSFPSGRGVLMEYCRDGQAGTCGCVSHPPYRLTWKTKEEVFNYRPTERPE